MKHKLAILLLSLTFAFPVFAQESTEVPTEAAPVIVVEVPVDEPAPDGLSDGQLLLAALGVAFGMSYVLYVSYLLYRSTPLEREQRQNQLVAAVDNVIEGAEKLSKETEKTELDDDLVKAFKTFWGMYKAGRFDAPETEQEQAVG